MSTDIKEWLEGLGLGQYAQTFSENDIDATNLILLSDDDLKELGLSLGHRRTLLASFKDESLEQANGAIGEAAPNHVPAVEAERRQLTVLFCDLVGSTELSAKLDPEDMREVLRAYQEACSKVIVRYEGYVAKFMGDGVYAYFGYPTAHEDDAERAISAGLGIVETVGELEHDLAVRIGIATGNVAVGDLIGEGAAEEANVVGEAPNLAARLQAIAEPNTVIIGNATHTLVGGMFEAEDLGKQDLKGFAELVEAWQVLRPSASESRFQAIRGENITELVGRDEELDILVRRWQRAKKGEGQIVLISGEPGIGKSRLLYAIREVVEKEASFVRTYQFSPQHSNSAMYPFIAQMQRAMGLAPDDTDATKLEKLEAWIRIGFQSPEEMAPIYGPAVGIDMLGRYPTPDVTPQRQKEMIFDGFFQRLQNLSSRKPVLYLVEDIHWIDPTSLELLCLQIERCRGTEYLLFVFTTRPEFDAPWLGQPHTTLLSLNRLDKAQCEALVRNSSGGAKLSQAVIEGIVERTDGVPLFVEELTKSVVESGSTGAHQSISDATISATNIPVTLQDALEARLDRLGSAKEIAQIGAVIGRSFDYDLLSRVAELEDDVLVSALDTLVKSGLAGVQGLPPTATYTFKHALVQDTAYGSLLRDRRITLHERIARKIENAFPDTAASEPEIVAHHLTEAGLRDDALICWQKAGELAARRSTFAEAEHHFTTALGLLSDDAPTREIKERELELRLALGPVLISANGMAAPEVSENYTRAQELGQELDDFPRRFTALFGLWTYNVQVDRPKASVLSDEMLDLARRRGESEYLLQAHHAAWTSTFVQGQLAANVAHSDSGWEIYDPDAHCGHAFTYGGHDPGVCSRTFSACAHVLMGRTEQAERNLEEGRNLARSLAHPASLGSALGFSALAFQMAHDTTGALDYAESAIRHCEESGLNRLLWMSASQVVRGWSLAVLESDDAAIQEIERGIENWTVSGSTFYHSYLLGLQADAERHLGRRDDAYATALKALEISERIGERWWRPELYRIIGLLQLDGSEELPREAEANFRESIRHAQTLEAKTLELRGSVSLARLWHSQGRASEARELLAPIHGWFSLSLDMADLKAAAALLDELS